MFFDVGELGQCTDAKPAAFFFDRIQTGNSFQVNEIVGLYDMIFHELQIFAAAADHRRAFLLLLKFLQQANCFLDAFHIDIFELIHGRSLLRPRRESRERFCPA